MFTRPIACDHFTTKLVCYDEKGVSEIEKSSYSGSCMHVLAKLWRFIFSPNTRLQHVVTHLAINTADLKRRINEKDRSEMVWYLQYIVLFRRHVIEKHNAYFYTYRLDTKAFDSQVSSFATMLFNRYSYEDFTEDVQRTVKEFSLGQEVDVDSENFDKMMTLAKKCESVRLHALCDIYYCQKVESEDIDFSTIDKTITKLQENNLEEAQKALLNKMDVSSLSLESAKHLMQSINRTWIFRCVPHVKTQCERLLQTSRHQSFENAFSNRFYDYGKSLHDAVVPTFTPLLKKYYDELLYHTALLFVPMYRNSQSCTFEIGEIEGEIEKRQKITREKNLGLFSGRKALIQQYLPVMRTRYPECEMYRILECMFKETDSDSLLEFLLLPKIRGNSSFTDSHLQDAKAVELIDFYLLLVRFAKKTASKELQDFIIRAIDLHLVRQMVESQIKALLDDKQFQKALTLHDKFLCELCSILCSIKEDSEIRFEAHAVPADYEVYNTFNALIVPVVRELFPETSIDCYFTSGQEEIACHKALLEKYSTIHLETEIELKPEEVAPFRELIGYLYTKKIVFTKENERYVIDLAKRFGIQPIFPLLLAWQEWAIKAGFINLKLSLRLLNSLKREV